MPSDKQRQAAGRRLRRRLLRIIEKHQGVARDVALRNEAHPDQPPLDAGCDLAVIALAKRMIACVDADRAVPDDLWKRFVDQVYATAYPNPDWESPLPHEDPGP